jgi:hypothetical protein
VAHTDALIRHPFASQTVDVDVKELPDDALEIIEVLKVHAAPSGLPACFM